MAARVLREMGRDVPDGAQNYGGDGYMRWLETEPYKKPLPPEHGAYLLGVAAHVAEWAHLHPELAVKHLAGELRNLDDIRRVAQAVDAVHPGFALLVARMAEALE